MARISGGYLGKVLRINLSDRSYREEAIDDSLFRSFLGGRGLAALAYFREIMPEVHPFGEANKLFFFTGPLTGTDLPSTTKFQLATKSPETGHYLCSNCGGDFAPHLKRCGFDGLIIEGQASKWTAISIRDNNVRFYDVSQWQGFSSKETLSALRFLIGEKKASAMSIGPAAERLVRISYINVDNRAFGRGGSGAVMGSKKLKGVVIHGSHPIAVSDPQSVSLIRKEANQELRKTRANHTRFGTPQYLEVINELGCMPTRNFQTTHFEHIDGVDAHQMVDRYLERNYACFNCPVACGKVNVVREGPYAGSRARTEYESIALLGPNCGVSDFGAIVRANQLCDDLGLDTMSAANAVALAMELYERGLIDRNDTPGIEARFGSAQALLDLIQAIAERKGIGDLLAEGFGRLKKVKPEWAPYIVEVKGMSFAAYDPRGFYGNGLTYGTSNRGACHNVGGWTIRAELQSRTHDRFALKGKGLLVKTIQDNRAYVDSLGICTVVRGSMGFSDHPEGQVMEAVTGYDFTPELLRIGERIYNLERTILCREGIRRRHDQLPQRIIKEAVPSGPIEGRTLTEMMYETMLDEYYLERGWDEDGVPRGDSINELGLREYIE